MSCTQCGKKFTPFSKQKVCSKCKFIICRNCERSFKLDGQVNSEKFCINCYKAIINPKEVNYIPPPPKAFLERIRGTDLFKEYQGIEPQAQSSLPKSNNSEENLYKRPKELNSDGAEHQVPSHVELECRLNKLRLGNASQFGCNEHENLSNDAVNRLMEKLAAEAKLDDLAGSSTGFPVADEPLENDPDESELPWCIICNEDAQIRCLDCENDLFCKSCYRKTHRQRGFENHKNESYCKSQK